ncbi:MAG: RNA polymerase sigma factor [Candidatus Pacebacteria bacterium]|nr:RNA polymerase sigma factor [Candidatus Paceibacterota bacterium]
MNTDEDLVREIKKGDDASFHILMSRYMKHVFNFILQYVRVREEAEDVTQDAFFKAWKHINRFKDGMKFKPWLFTIARNTALDYIKKKKAVVFSEMDQTDSDGEAISTFSDTLTDEAPLPPEIFANKELGSQLDVAMNILHPDHRAVLIMHYHEDMTFEEIADTIKKPMNTIKSWHRRSLEKIRDSLVHIRP